MTVEEWFTEEFPEHDFGTMYSKRVIGEAWQAAQAAERERANKLIVATRVLEMLAGQALMYDDPIRVEARAAIAKYEGESNEP